jgi:hypothetical protein
LLRLWRRRAGDVFQQRSPALSQLDRQRRLRRGLSHPIGQRARHFDRQRLDTSAWSQRNGSRPALLERCLLNVTNA